MKVAVEGCCHGELDKIYETIEYIGKKDGVKVDLLLICGDFQAVRNDSPHDRHGSPAQVPEAQHFLQVGRNSLTKHFLQFGRNSWV